MKIRSILISLSFAFLFPLYTIAAVWGKDEAAIDKTETSLNLDSVFKNKGIPVEKAVKPEHLNPITINSNQSSKTKVIQDSISIKIETKSEIELPDTVEVTLIQQPDTENEEIIVSETQEVIQDVAVLKKQAFEPILLDSANFINNPLFNELVYKGKDIQLDWRKNDIDSLLYGRKPSTLNQPFKEVTIQHPVEILVELRQDACDYITQTAPGLYKTTFDKLPKINWEQQYQAIEIAPKEHLRLEENQHVPVVSTNRIILRKKKISLWDTKLHALVQFSQTAISENWHKGGTDFFSLLGVFSGHMNYDNKKKVKWENNFEWRTGFNTVTADTIGNKGGRKAMPSDDILKINSKYGVKATGDFYYSTSLEFQTQFFDNPKGVNNFEMKARFLTPIRLNIGVGMEYNYKKLSVALSPVSFKYIYLADTTKTSDGFYLNPNIFGIETGENQLKEFGSKLIVELKEYRPIPEFKLYSKFIFYTNYEKVEIDWELIAELAFNRFFSTRLMLNPHYDNTVILEGKDKAKIQMKEMLTVGFSYRIY